MLDVGAGSGVLTAELVERVGAENVIAIDPSVKFVDAIHDRYPASTCVRGRPSSCPTPTAGSTPRSRSWSSTSWPTRWPGSARWAE